MPKTIFSRFKKKFFDQSLKMILSAKIFISAAGPPWQNFIFATVYRKISIFSPQKTFPILT